MSAMPTKRTACARRILSLLLSILFALPMSGCAAQADKTQTQLIALNVGKADCLLLLYADQALLIDAGYAYTYGLLRQMLQAYGVTHLNGVFLTHCDKDHYGGLMQLSQSDVQVDAWYAAAIYHDTTPEAHPMVLAAQARGEAVQWLNAGDTLSFGSGVVRVLGPLSRNETNENNNSLVFEVSTPDGELLFTGDMKAEEETELLLAGAFHPVQVLKVPFHGDNSASGDGFVQAVMPELALISTSTQQEPDTPASSTLRRYARVGAACLVTQDTQYGYEITLQNGRVSTLALCWEQPAYDQLSAVISLGEDLLTLRNSGSEPILLDGWLIYSTRGETVVPLPQGAVLPANGVYKIGTLSTTQSVDFQTDIKRLWHKSKLDQAIIYDALGNVAAVTDNGLAE